MSPWKPRMSKQNTSVEIITFCWGKSLKQYTVIQGTRYMVIQNPCTQAKGDDMTHIILAPFHWEN